MSSDYDSFFFDIAMSLECKSLAFFVGTGMSKNLNSAMPNWCDLLTSVARGIEDEDYIEKMNKRNFKISCIGAICESFTPAHKKTFDDFIEETKKELWIDAQMLENLYKSEQKAINHTVAEIIREAEDETSSHVEDNIKKLSKFLKLNTDIDIITTNYDTLLSEYVLPNSSNIIVKGQPISPKMDKTNIYHIHGCKDFPETMVLTESDYLDFLHNETYFSRKFFTMLQEKTIVILGYSLQDFNLKRILDEAQKHKPEAIAGGIYFVTREPVEEVQKDYYQKTFKINVIDDCEINDFLDEVKRRESRVKSAISEIKNIGRDAICGEAVNQLLKKPYALSLIFYAAYINGISFSNEDFLIEIQKVLKNKKTATHDDNAWKHYQYLAIWLINIAKKIDLASVNDKFKEVFLDCVVHSLNYAKREVGFSFAAFDLWKKEYRNIPLENKNILDEYIRTHSFSRNSYSALNEMTNLNLNAHDSAVRDFS